MILDAYIHQYTTYLLLDVFYNLSFHPLSKYPGPKIFAATPLANTYYVLQGTRVYKVTELHEKYGPVSVAPSQYTLLRASSQDSTDRSRRSQRIVVYP